MFRRITAVKESPLTADRERIYAVGDIHGRIDLLRDLLQVIIDHYESLPLKANRVKLVFLGDVIDRGPDSAKCVALIRSLVESRGAVLLRGNHEDMLIASLEGNPQAQEAWLRNGGDTCLESYGIAPPRPEEDAFDFAERLSSQLPEDDIAFLRSLPVSYASGDYFFVHAGVRPGVDLPDQDPEDLFSIRDEFTLSENWHGAMVVHGHEIVETVELRSNRIACDTGAYKTGTLSCVCLQDDFKTILSSQL